VLNLVNLAEKIDSLEFKPETHSITVRVPGYAYACGWQFWLPKLSHKMFTTSELHHSQPVHSPNACVTKWDRTLCGTKGGCIWRIL